MAGLATGQWGSPMRIALMQRSDMAAALVIEDGAVLCERTRELLPCGPKWRKLVKLFKKQKSKFYWYDFTVGSRRYRGSTQETKSVRALQVASLKLASVMGNNDALPSKPSVVQEFAQRFLDWVNRGRLEEKTRKFYRNGWRLLKDTSVAETRIDRITSDYSEQLKFPA